MNIYSNIQRLIDAKHDASAACNVPGATLDDLRAAREVRAELEAAKSQACKEFAALHGWRVARRFTIDQLRRGSNVRRNFDARWLPTPLGHPNYFRLAQRPWCPVAIVSHEYSPFADSLAFAEREGLIAELLPVSWYWPGGRINAVLYMAASEPRR